MTSVTIPDEFLPVITEIYELGRKARQDGVPLDQNPFANGDSHRSWKVGWKAEDARIGRDDC